MTTEQQFLGNEEETIKTEHFGPTVGRVIPLPTPPSVGRIVHYKLTPEDARRINVRREDADLMRPGSRREGTMVHVGNRAHAGDVYAAMIVRVWNNDLVNLQVHTDGNDLYWVTSASQGEDEGDWNWPPRV